MLSVCIPIYNNDISQLVDSLSLQSANLDIAIDIIAVDDASEANFRAVNKKCLEGRGRYIQLNENVGRARIRNIFIDLTSSEYLLFLDCDSVIVSKLFLRRYTELIRLYKSQIVCGGRIYDEKKPGKHMLLHWKYGREKESKPASERNKFPYKSFMTSNFMIRKDVLINIKFDERIASYGHEDTLFGFQLQKNGISIDHIQNPVLHGEIETNSRFITKTEMGLRNLVLITGMIQNNPDFIENVTILKFYEKCKRYGLDRFIYLLSFLVLKGMKFILLSGYVNLFFFDCYKLCYMIRMFKTNMVKNSSN